MQRDSTSPSPDPSQTRESGSGSFVADSLAIGMLVMLAITIVQRGIGFIRGIWFCRALDDAVVGQWSMAYEFIVIVTPVMLLGMPGSLPRYVEHYRIRGQLTAFVRRLLTVTVALGSLFFMALWICPQWFAWLVFLDSQSTSLVFAIGISVLAIIAFNFTHELVASLRQVRVASLMQFVQAVGFTVIAISWLSWGGGVAGIIVSFALGTLLGIIPGGLVLAAGWSGLPKSPETLRPPAMWRRVLPFALSLWAMNLLTNVFALSDRYMILHLMPGGELDGQAAVGQYHSGRMFPTLLISLSAMISGVMLPYLSAEWESGRREVVGQWMRKILFATSAGFTLAAAATLLVAPWVFSELLQGRYSDGLSLMPMAFVFAIWVAIANVGQDYLWVAERGKLVAAAMAAGLLSNVLLNLLLLPMWGLPGAVAATLVANGVVVLALWAAMSRHGYHLDRTSFYVTVMPLTLLAGPWVAMVCVAITCLINEQSKAWTAEFMEQAMAKLDRRRPAQCGDSSPMTLSP